MTAEEAIKEYPVWVRRKKALEMQIRNFNGLSETEFIESLNFSHPQEEKVQTSGFSDKTAKIAMIYKKHFERWESEDKERFNRLLLEYRDICSSIEFLEYGIYALSGCLPELISDMVINGLSWEELKSKYKLSHSALARQRKKAIRELDVLYC